MCLVRSERLEDKRQLCKDKKKYIIYYSSEQLPPPRSKLTFKFVCFFFSTLNVTSLNMFCENVISP